MLVNRQIHIRIKTQTHRTVDHSTPLLLRERSNQLTEAVIISVVSRYVAGLRSSYTVDYDQFVNRTLTPYISAARNVTIVTTAAAAVVLVTVMVGRLLGRVFLRHLHRISTRTKSESVVAVAGSLMDEGHTEGHSEGHFEGRFEGHLDDLCECHVTSAMTSPSAGSILYPCNYSETIV